MTHVCMTLQDLAILCQDIDLSLISCLYCCTSNTGVHSAGYIWLPASSAGLTSS
jgi:hypothetical protein